MSEVEKPKTKVVRSEKQIAAFKKAQSVRHEKLRQLNAVKPIDEKPEEKPVAKQTKTPKYVYEEEEEEPEQVIVIRKKKKQPKPKKIIIEESESEEEEEEPVIKKAEKNRLEQAKERVKKAEPPPAQVAPSQTIYFY